MVKKVNRFWWDRQESICFGKHKTIVPRTAYTMLDSVQMQSDMTRFCEHEFKGHDTLCEMLDRLQRDFDGGYDVPPESHN